MNGWTRVFLVSLRLAIGWHLLFEGLDKIQSVNVGPVPGKSAWTSKPYLREAVGPLAPFFREQAGDTHEEALALLEVRPLNAGDDPAKIPPKQRLSPALEQAWNQYFERFKKHYELSEEQTPLAQVKLDQAKDKAVLWMLSEKQDKEVEKQPPNSPLGSYKVKEAPPQRIAAYRAKVQQIQDIEGKELPAFGHDVQGAKLRALKAEANRQRAELLNELQRPLVESLDSELTAEQKKKGPATELAESARPWYSKTRLEWIDLTTRYGLAVAGAGLLLGLFTRTACLGGILFLLLFYLSQPPLPWVAENIRAEGHYYFVNKNLIELLALLTLMTTRSGQWLGLDGIVQFLTPWGRRALAKRQREAESAGVS